MQAVKDLHIAVRIIEINRLTLHNASNSPITDYEDAVQHECAVAESLDAVVTRNLKDYKNASVKIYSPREFLKMI